MAGVTGCGTGRECISEGGGEDAGEGGAGSLCAECEWHVTLHGPLGSDRTGGPLLYAHRRSAGGSQH